MAKAKKKTAAASSTRRIAKPADNTTRVVKASPAKTTIPKQTILSAVLAVRSANLP